MLASEPPNIDPARVAAERAVRDGHRVSEVISRLRNLFSKKPAMTEPVDLNGATREVIALTRNEVQRHRATVRLELDERLPKVRGDRIQIQQVIVNLLRNAVEAMSAVDDHPRDVVVATTLGPDDAARLSVRDVGAGFEPLGVARVFDPFYTTKADGMGIGLSVSRSIVESHGGRIWAAPNDGAGVTFSFSIPCVTEEGQ
jgi:C4-dicarboxylate-specific signal transduction histidine kinase